MPTPEQALAEYSRKEQELFFKLIPVARAAANALRDAKMENSAKALEEILFEIDVNESTIKEAILNDMHGFFEVLQGL